MKVFLVGLWLTVVALGSTFGAATFLFSRKDTAAAAPAPVTLQSQKTRVLNVPMIADGALRGFVSMQFVYTTDVAAAKNLTVSPEVFILDEAFRTLYSDNSLDFTHLEKFDVARLTRHLVEDTNAHLGVPLVKDVLIADMNYAPKDAPKDPAPK